MGTVTTTSIVGGGSGSAVPEAIRNEFERVGKVQPPSQAYVRPDRIHIDSQCPRTNPSKYYMYIMHDCNKIN